MKKFSIFAFLLLCVSTLQASVTYVLKEDFDESMPATWTLDPVASPSWAFQTGTLTNPTGTYSGAGRVGTPERAGNGTKLRLISPMMDLTGVFRPKLTFAHAQSSRTVQGKTYCDKLSVYYRTNPTSEWLLLITYSEPIIAWKADTIELPATNSTTYQFAFEANCSIYGRGVVLDAVSVMPTVQCDNIAGFGIRTRSTQSDISINASPIATGFEPPSWNCRIWQIQRGHPSGQTTT